MPDPHPSPSALDVVRAVLATHLPPAASPDDRAHLIVAALIEHGHLPRPEHTTTPEDIEEFAQWLAEQSQFPRYTTPDGWRRIVASTADVNVATAKALTFAATDEEVGLIRRTSYMLLRHANDAAHMSTSPSDR